MSKLATKPAAPSAPHDLDLQSLCEEHGEYVRRLVSHLLSPYEDPDDLAQEVFLIAWRKLKEFRGGSVRSWLGAIAIQRARSWRRRHAFWRFCGLEAAGELIDPRTPEAEAQHNEANRLAYAVLERMSEKRRTVFILFEIEGMSGQEIAAALGCPLRTVYTRLYHARNEFESRFAALPEAAKYEVPR